MITNATQFVELVENRLGWQPPAPNPRWKAVAIAAGKVNKKITENPHLYTWQNLELTVQMLVRERFHIRSPLGVFYHVARAVAAAHQSVTSDLSAQIHMAVTEAFLAGEADWVETLSRAVGDARYDVLEQWKAHRVDA